MHVLILGKDFIEKNGVPTEVFYTPMIAFLHHHSTNRTGQPK
jgi:hypothetical protein